MRTLTLESLSNLERLEIGRRRLDGSRGREGGGCAAKGLLYFIMKENARIHAI